MENLTREKTYIEEINDFYEEFLPKISEQSKLTSEPDKEYFLQMQTYRIVKKMLAEINRLENALTERMSEINCETCTYCSQYSDEEGFYKCGVIKDTFVAPYFGCKVYENRYKKDEKENE